MGNERSTSRRDRRAYQTVKHVADVAEARLAESQDRLRSHHIRLHPDRPPLRGKPAKRPGLEPTRRAGKVRDPASIQFGLFARDARPQTRSHSQISL
jgi:hypothetical protein